MYLYKQLNKCKIAKYIYSKGHHGIVGVLNVSQSKRYDDIGTGLGFTNPKP